jgi:hypothetical protein
MACSGREAVRVRCALFVSAAPTQSRYRARPPTKPPQCINHQYGHTTEAYSKRDADSLRDAHLAIIVGRKNADATMPCDRGIVDAAANDQLLLAAAEIEEAVGIEMADITGAHDRRVAYKDTGQSELPHAGHRRYLFFFGAHAASTMAWFFRAC